MFSYFSLHANLLWTTIEPSRLELPLAEPPAEKVSIHLVHLTSKREEASAAVNLKRQDKYVLYNMNLFQGCYYLSVMSQTCITVEILIFYHF